MVRQMFLLVMLGTFLAIGGFWALRAQDPATPQTPTTTTQTQPQTTMQTTQVDLSGTYTGTFVNCDAGGLSGEQTLTINGNQFTTADGKSGHIIASRTKGYTAVALQLSGAGSPVMSFRGKKSGTKLTLSPITGATSQCMFTTSKSAGSKATPTTTTPTATGTEVSNPTTTTPSTMPSQRPSPSPTVSPSPEASPEPNPEPNPSPSGSPRPRPNPSPSEPTPSPSPSPSPRF